MNRSIILFAAALLASAPATAAYAQEATLEHDLQCLIVTSSLTEAEEQEAKLAGMLGSLFFMGKIFGGDPDIDINSALELAARQFDRTTATSLLQECGEEMEQRGSQVEAAGKHLVELGL
jgi:hypothetical protein